MAEPQGPFRVNRPTIKDSVLQAMGRALEGERPGTGVPQQPGDNSTPTGPQTVVQGPDGRFYIIPLVWNGQQVDEQAAMQQAAAVGWDRWPAFNTQEEAMAQLQQMQQTMDSGQAQESPNGLRDEIQRAYQQSQQEWGMDYE